MGSSRISTASHLTKPRMVREGMDGGKKSLSEGWRVCWQPMLLQMYERLSWCISRKRPKHGEFSVSGSILCVAWTCCDTYGRSHRQPHGRRRRASSA